LGLLRRSNERHLDRHRDADKFNQANAAWIHLYGFVRLTEMLKLLDN